MSIRAIKNLGLQCAQARLPKIRAGKAASKTELPREMKSSEMKFNVLLGVSLFLMGVAIAGIFFLKDSNIGRNRDLEKIVEIGGLEPKQADDLNKVIFNGQVSGTLPCENGPGSCVSETYKGFLADLRKGMTFDAARKKLADTVGNNFCRKIKAGCK